jgi:precorrin-3B methylase
MVVVLAVPEVGVTVSVVFLTPRLVGVKVMTPVVQIAEAAWLVLRHVSPVVAMVNSGSVKVYGEAPNAIDAPAVISMVPHVTGVPTEVIGQVTGLGMTATMLGVVPVAPDVFR